jgi:hypothetical protein
MRKVHLIGAGLFVIAFWGSTLLCDSRPPHPTDKALTDYFNKHRTDFDRLVTMALEDGSLRAIYADEVMLSDYRIWPTRTAEGFSTGRWNEYQVLFARLSEYDIDSINKQSDQIQFTASIGVSPLDDLEDVVITKGYAYSVKEPAPLVGSLDEMGFDSVGTHYLRIGQYWYLYHDHGISKPE